MRPEGPPGRVVALALDGAFQLVSSPAISAEVREALTYPKVRKAIRAAVDVTEWMDAVDFLAEFVADRDHSAQLCADPDDDKFVWAAHEGGATYVVTGDAALLALREHEGVRVVRPAEFLEIVKP
jgi:putative PIN family toxin of toxin-antitoxin system